MKTLARQLLQTTKIIILALILAFGISYLYAAWSPPTATPPSGNTPAPINVGSVNQEKTGAFGSSDYLYSPEGLFSYGWFAQWLMIGGSVADYELGPDVGEQPLILDVEGAVGAAYYCDQNGNNCVAPPLGGGGGGGGGSSPDYDSGWISWTGGSRTVSHGLGTVPLVVVVQVKSKVNSGNITIGDTFTLDDGYWQDGGTATHEGSGVWFNSTEIGFASHFNVGQIVIGRGGTKLRMGGHNSDIRFMAWKSGTGGGGGGGDTDWTEVTPGGTGNIYRSLGNVGIGTVSPGAKLEVAGQVKITGGTPGAGKVLTSDASGLGSWQTPAGGGGGGLKSIQTFKDAGSLTWTKPAGIKRIFVEVWGAGGGGGNGASSGSTPGGGGGGGGYCAKIVDVSVINSVSVNVGAGGGIGSLWNSNGGPGGSSSFGTHCSATGGGGGAASGAAGGLGGTGSGGDINLVGGTGAPGGNSATLAGYGGMSPRGGAGGVRNAGVGQIPGGGGAGTYQLYAGRGADGMVIVWEYE